MNLQKEQLFISTNFLSQILSKFFISTIFFSHRSYQNFSFPPFFSSHRSYHNLSFPPFFSSHRSFQNFSFPQFFSLTDPIKIFHFHKSSLTDRIKIFHFHLFFSLTDPITALHLLCSLGLRQLPFRKNFLNSAKTFKHWIRWEKTSPCKPLGRRVGRHTSWADAHSSTLSCHLTVGVWIFGFSFCQVWLQTNFRGRRAHLAAVHVNKTLAKFFPSISSLLKIFTTNAGRFKT